MKPQFIGIIFYLLLAADFSHGYSLYTSIDPAKCSPPDKQLVAGYEAEGLGVQECEASQPWKLLAVSSDEWSWVDLKYGDQIWTTEDEVAYKNDFGNFPNLGSSVVEWIVRHERKPAFLIFRVNAQSPKESATSNAKVSRLFVISLLDNRPAFCGTARTNEEARALATGDKKCSRELPLRKLRAGIKK